MKDTFLSLRHITKRFPGVLALNDITFSLEKGEVHALVGENGAGKSTLMNILGGLLQPDQGEILLEGRKVTIANPSQAFDSGIGFVHQESNLLSNLTVLENVFLSREHTRMARLDKRAMHSAIVTVNQKLGYDIDPEARVSALSLAERQCVEIARSLVFSPRILILDEPTAALDEDEVARLFRIIRMLREEGVTVIYISHRLDEIFQIADRITVLKDGQIVGVRAAAEVSKDDLISMMVGRVLEDIYPDRSGAAPGKVLLSVEHLSTPGKLRDVSFSVRAGEIVGLGGLEGHGQRDIARVVFGDLAASAGSITVDGTVFRGRGIRGRIRHGVGYVTDDRRGEGLIFTQSLRENCAVASLYKRSRLGFVDEKREKQETNAHVSQMQIKAASINQPVSNLSGGNQQKVMLARWLMTKPKVLIIDEPTKGVDVGARMSVYQIINDLTKQGIAILMLTSDMMELIGLSDRILVMCEGRINDEIPRAEATEERIMHAASAVPQEGGERP